MKNLKLHSSSSFRGRRGPLVIVVMDGVGVGRNDEGNAVFLARTPVLDELRKVSIYTQLKAHGTAVGMPSDEDMGNSEIGHNAIGAGRIFDQGAKMVNQAFETRAIYQSAVWQKMIHSCLEKDKPLHFIGLLSDGNVHSHINHLFAMIREADAAGLQQVYVHPLLDGRDVGKTTALEYIRPLEDLLAEISRQPQRRYKIASGGGRMLVTMDRYNANWSVVRRGWYAHVLGIGRPFVSAEEAINTYRKEIHGLDDQNMPEFVIVEGDKPVATIEDGHSVIFFNFRGDRAIEITRAFEEEKFTEFDRVRWPKTIYAGMMQYDGDLLVPKQFLVSPPDIDRTIGEYLCSAGIRQFAISETQKYGHVTYFWNGNRSGKFDENLESYFEIPSDRVQFNERPWMKAAEITDKTIELINSGEFRFGRLNYPNGDMVGHTGVLVSAIIAVETVDLCLGRLLEAIRETEGIAIVTADHGNSDEMIMTHKKTGKFIIDENSGRPVPKTSHTLNPVPCYIFDPSYENEYHLNPTIEQPGLSNLAATALYLLGFEAPDDYDPSLVI